MEADNRVPRFRNRRCEGREGRFIRHGQTDKVVRFGVPLGRFAGSGEHIGHERMGELGRLEARREIPPNHSVEFSGGGGIGRNRTFVSEVIGLRILAVRRRRRGAWGWNRTTYIRGSTAYIPALCQ